LIEVPEIKEKAVEEKILRQTISGYIGSRKGKTHVNSTGMMYRNVKAYLRTGTHI